LKIAFKLHKIYGEKSGRGKIEIFQEKKAKAKNMTRDYFVQKSTKIGDMRRRENAKNRSTLRQNPNFCSKNSSSQ